MRFSGGVAIVTGGGAGIGRATARRLAAEGAAVVVTDLDDAAAQAVAAEIGGRAVAGDVADAAHATAAVQAAGGLGRLSVLVNNAAYTTRATLDEVSAEDWDREFAVTLRGAWLMTRAALPMLRDGGGAIVNVGSVNGLMHFGNPAYSAAKAGLLSLTRTLAHEEGRHGIRANMVSPGSVRTDAPTWTIRQQRDPAIFERLARWYPVGRVGRPEDIAAAVCFLAADEAGFINGANLVVDGGLTSGMGVMVEELTLERESGATTVSPTPL